MRKRWRSWRSEEVDVVKEVGLDKQIALVVACCPCGNTNPLTTSKVDCIRCKQVWYAECLGIGGVTEDLVGTWINYLCPYCFVVDHTRARARLAPQISKLRNPPGGWDLARSCVFSQALLSSGVPVLAVTRQ